MRNLAESCTCGDCEKGSKSSRSLDFWYSECARNGFLSSLYLYTADILTISLFEDPDNLLVFHSCIQESGGLQSIIRNILKSGERTEGTPWEVFSYALKLVGHKELDRLEGVDQLRWIISCYKGQAVYPKVFETGDICQPGYLALYWTPGLLFFDGERYDRGIDLEIVTNRLETESVMEDWSRSVTKPLNLYPDIKSEWKVASRDGYLEIHLSCERSIGHPSSILSNLAYALVIICPHDSASPLHRPDPDSRYLNFFFLAAEGLSNSRSGEGVDVLGVDGNTDLRMFAISVLPGTQMPLVIRNNACLQCCLDLCRQTAFGYVMC